MKRGRLPPWLSGLLLLLVLANAVLFAWGHGWLGGNPGSTQRDPARLAQQSQPERLRLLNAQEAAAAQRPLACREIGSFNDPAAVLAAEAALQSQLQLGPERWQRLQRHQPGVYLLTTQRADNAAEVASKRARLERDGIVPERSQNVLGETEPSWIVKRFASEAEARAAQAELRASKNLRLRVITQRLPVDQTWLRVNGLSEAQTKATHPAWPGGLRPCELGAAAAQTPAVLPASAPGLVASGATAATPSTAER